MLIYCKFLKERVLKEANINTQRKNRYTLNEYFFEKIDTERKAYILGLLFADGFVGNEKLNNIVLVLKEQDKYILEEIAKEIEFTGEITEASKGSYENSGQAWKLSFSSKIMAEQLRNYGIIANRIYKMNIPNIDNNLFRHFLRGYFDGNGSISVYNQLYETKNGISSCKSYEWNIISSEEFLKAIEKRLPIICKYKKSNNTQLKYLRCLNRKGIQFLYQYLYKDASLYLKRKFNIFQKSTCPADE